MRYGVLLLLLSWVVSALGSDAGERQGYLISVRVQGDTIQLDRATTLPRFEPVVSLPGKETWQVELRDATEDLLWSAQVPPPDALALGMAPGQPLMMSFRVPAPVGEGLLRLRDAHGEVRFSVYMDAAFAQKAQREREEFLDWLGSTAKADDADETALAQAEAYIARQQGIMQQRKAQDADTSTRCQGPDMRFIPELADTATPCLPVPGHDHTHAMPEAKAAREGADVAQNTVPTASDAAAPKAKVTLNGRILAPDGTAPAEAFWVYVNDGVEQTSYWLDAQGRFTAQVEEGNPLTITAYPPAPWLADVFTDAGISGTASREFRLERGVQVTGKVTMPGVTIGSYQYWLFAFYERQGRPLYGMSWLASDGSYQLAIPRNAAANVTSSLPHPFLWEHLVIGPYSSDAVHNITPVRGVAFRGRLTSDSGTVLQSPYLYLYGNGVSYGRPLPIDASGQFDALIEPARGYRINAGADRHFQKSLSLAPQSADVEHNIVLERGIALSGQVLERAGGPVANYAVVQVLDVAGQLLSEVSVSASGYFQLLRKQARHFLEAGRNSEIWPAPVIVDAGTTDMTRNLYVPPRHNVSIFLYAPDHEPMAYSRVEIWEGERFLIGVRTNAAGAAVLTLPNGSYTARVRPHEYGFRGNDYSGLHLYGHGIAPKNFTVSGPMTLDVTLAQSQIARMKVESAWVSGDTANFVGRRFELLSGNNVVAVSRGWGGYETSAQGVRFVADMHVPNGRTYKLRMHTPGLPTWTSDAFTSRAGGVVSIGFSPSATSRRWKGKVRHASGQAFAQAPYTVYDQAQVSVAWGNASASGDFDVPACEGCTYWFGAPSQGSALGYFETLGAVSASFNRDVKLTQALAFEPQTVRDRSLQRLWGSATGEKYDILFIGDGYTAGNETFTDTNGNGIWDGVLYYDLNQNGVWNTNEPYAVYGNAAWPTDGQNPSATNEPFNDLNGDGALNIGEAQVFFSNARDYLRALLSYDYWRTHRHAFRAWTYLAFSEQAGSSMYVPGTGTIVSRNSLLSSTVETERYLLSIDYTRASQLAAEVLPSADTIVVLINQPIPVGRANSFILANGGLLAGSPNTATPAHEFGHKVGGLADEYDEFIEPLKGGTPWGGHMTRSLDRRMVPWRDLLPTGFSMQVPTAPGATGVGVFEGGSYQGSGVYRSAFNSTMRYLGPKFAPNQKTLMDTRVLPLLTNAGYLTIAPVKQCDGTGLARIRVLWDVRGLGVSRIQVRSGSLDGNAFATSTLLNSAATTGKWGRNGSTFYLVDADTGALLDIAQATVTTEGCPSHFVTFDPAPASTCRADLKATTRIYWNVTTATPDTLRLTVEHPDGTTTHTTRTARRGSMEVLAAKGTKVRLRNHTSGANLATATLDVNALGCNKLTFTATPNPIPDCDGDGKGVTRVAWDVRQLSNRPIDIRLRTINGTRWHDGGANGSRETGNWLKNNDKLLLIDRQSGTLLAEQTIRVRPGTSATCPGS